MRLAFRSFRARLLTFVVGLLVAVQGAVLLAVGTAHEQNALEHVHEALELTAGAFRRTLSVRDQILLEKARLLSSDFAFKQAIATSEHGTVLSALQNHQARVGADVMLLLGMDERVVADTLHPRRRDAPNPLPGPLEAAKRSEFGEASSVEFVDGVPYQLVVVPLFTPEPSAWIAIGFVIDDAFAAELRRETGTHVTLVRRRPSAQEGWTAFASTLPDALLPGVAGAVPAEPSEAASSRSVVLDGREYVTGFAAMPGAAGTRVAAVLQRSLDEAMAPFLRVRRVLVAIFGLGVALSLVGGTLLAARVTRPVDALAGAARRVARGDYGRRVEVDQEDELGVLASSFNHMMKGLRERDRVRELLGKVVSPEIAEELLSKEIALGGEERRVSVLFSDVRDFTSISERESAADLVALLNAYLTRVSAVVERHGGVVDKYIGDAVMALFGAPLAHEDDAARAVRTALEMVASLDVVNDELGRSGDRRLAIGVGVNTDVVVAGNMGSRTRLNYTVIGDGVNLASRLEGLTKRYGVGVVVSESTREGCPDLAFRELDRVRVKGKDRPVRIFEPWGEAASLDASDRERLARHRDALAAYQARRFEAAAEGFAELARDPRDARVATLYLERIRRFRETPPPADWDGTFRFDEK